MELKWEYALPTDEHSSDYQYESPILVKDNHVYYISESAHADNLHIIDEDTGKGKARLLKQSIRIISSKYFFLSYKDKVIMYAGDLHFVQDHMVINSLEFVNKGEITSYLVKGNYLYVSCRKREHATLNCIDLEKMVYVWEIDISNTKPYDAGELQFFENQITCFGRDQLLFIQPEDGVIIYSIKIPRINKLYCPIKIGEDSLLIGYTNWTNAGILKYQLTTKKVLWRHKRNFEGPQLKCQIYKNGNKAFWVKNGTELIAVNIENGEEFYRFRTAPWLYTKLYFLSEGVLYGTAGADGYLNLLDIETGMKRWEAFLKNGCAYYALMNDTVLVGDFSKTILQISIHNGALTQALAVDGEVVGRITESNGFLYTVIWGNEGKDIRLIKIQIS